MGQPRPQGLFVIQYGLRRPWGRGGMRVSDRDQLPRPHWSRLIQRFEFN